MGEELIWAMRTGGGSEVIKETITRECNWDGYSNVASIAATLFGSKKGYKLEASIFFPDQAEGNSVRIFDINLDTFIFRGSMVVEP